MSDKEKKASFSTTVILQVTKSPESNRSVLPYNFLNTKTLDL